MIKELKIRSLKSINRLCLKCSSLNIFVGPNSSGKSTILQSLLLLSQNCTNQLYGLNGPLVSLGDFRETKNFNTKSQKISISVLQKNNQKVLLEFFDNDVEKQIQLTSNTNFEEIENFKYTSNKFKFLSSQRIGYQDVYMKDLLNSTKMDSNGEYAISYLQRNSRIILEENMAVFKNDYTLFAQVNYWLNYMLKTEIAVENIVGTDLIKASYEFNDTKFVRPKNIGAGTSYLISIIITCLISRKDDIIVIESPEIHLHPTAQSKLCEFLYFISNCDRQLFIETHSDHIFNGIRAGIATKKYKENKVVINYVSMGDKNCTSVNVIKIGEHGRIDNNYPELFNQFDNDLDKMLGI